MFRKLGEGWDAICPVIYHISRYLLYVWFLLYVPFFAICLVFEGRGVFFGMVVVGVVGMVGVVGVVLFSLSISIESVILFTILECLALLGIVLFLLFSSVE